MGQRTLAFTKQMLRVFNFAELEELDHLVVEAWLSIHRSSDTALYSQREVNTKGYKQTNIYA
jgi:hypothetical protein